MGEPSFYQAVGGEEFFTRLIHRFYQGVATDPVLRPVYPARDLGPAEEHLRLFLMQYWGGPRTYDELRGHPRLRMRTPGSPSARPSGTPGCTTCGSPSMSSEPSPAWTRRSPPSSGTTW